MSLAQEYIATAIFLRSASVIFVETLCMVPERRGLSLRNRQTHSRIST